MTDKNGEIQAKIGKLAAELMAVEITDHFAKAMLHEENWFQEYPKKYADKSHTTNLTELPEVRKVLRAYEGFLEAASSWLTQLLDQYGGDLTKCTGEGGRHVTSSLCDIMEMIKAQMDEEDASAKIEDKEEKEETIPIEAVREGFLNYWAELIEDTAKDCIPLPQHVIEAMGQQGIVLIAMAGRPINGLEACGACTVLPQHHRTLIFEHGIIKLDIGPAYGVWLVHAEGIPEDSIRRFKCTLHGLETEAIVARAKDLGEYKGGA